MAEKMVIVGCKIPNGLKLQLRGPMDPVTAASAVLWEFVLQGCAQNMQPYVRENAVGLTSVPEAEWNAWEAWAMEAKYKPYLDGLIFSASSLREVQAEAKDKVALRSGLEQLDLPLHPDAPPSKDSRLSGFRKDAIQPTTALV